MDRLPIALLAIVVLLGALSCGPAFEPCTVPPGTYTQKVSDAGGNCPQRVVDEITSISREVEIESGTRCGTVTSERSETLEDGCETDGTFTVRRHESGIDDGELHYEVSCPNGETCSHDFTVHHEKKADEE